MVKKEGKKVDKSKIKEKDTKEESKKDYMSLKRINRYVYFCAAWYLFGGIPCILTSLRKIFTKVEFPYSLGEIVFNTQGEYIFFMSLFLLIGIYILLIGIFLVKKNRAAGIFAFINSIFLVLLGLPGSFWLCVLYLAATIGCFHYHKQNNESKWSKGEWVMLIIGILFLALELFIFFTSISN